ncbi:PadR family transcriptional regulator [Microlunatus ginsengisoli]|uniref:PadR family transcriptional regulator n=1 Tax=Microlunatus ginsengisoli TaxID=363863 RepID=A0ABP6ZCI3_9ACTN
MVYRALTPTAQAILGFLSFRSRSGYEIRQAAQRTAGLVWGVSDGQLYPQLHDLHARGLIEPDGAPEGPKSRQRWRLTDAGREALQAWLREPAAPPVLRDEGLLKLLFVDEVGLDVARDLLERRRAGLVALRESVLSLVPGAERGGPDAETGLTGPTLVRAFGLDFLEMSIAWCDQALAQLGRRRRGGNDGADAGDHQASQRAYAGSGPLSAAPS